MRSNALATLLMIATIAVASPGRAVAEPSPPPDPERPEATSSGSPGDGLPGEPGTAPGGEVTVTPRAAPPGRPGQPGQPGQPGAQPGQPAQIAQVAFTSANFETFQPNADAVTYRPDLVPPGAEVSALSTSRPEGRTTVLLTIHGLLPNRRYGAHVHQNRCGAKPEDAGPHFQHVPDPKQPSVNPAYANPRNEIWLDFTTDKDGNATSTSTVNWRFTDRHPKSIVLHAEGTHTGAGHAGEAGGRAGCLNMDF